MTPFFVVSFFASVLSLKYFFPGVFVAFGVGHSLFPSFVLVILHLSPFGLICLFWTFQGSRNDFYLKRFHFFFLLQSPGGKAPILFFQQLSFFLLKGAFKLVVGVVLPALSFSLIEVLSPLFLLLVSRVCWIFRPLSRGFFRLGSFPWVFQDSLRRALDYAGRVGRPPRSPPVANKIFFSFPGAVSFLNAGLSLSFF